MSLPTKTIALVSGANQGIGLAIATALARDHQYHVLIGSRTLSNGQKAAEQLNSEGFSAEAVQLDITSDASIAAAAAHITTAYGRLDVLVNNAGIFLDSPATTTEGASLRNMYAATLDTNVIGTACLTEAVLPLLRKCVTHPRVVFVSSTMGSLTVGLDKSTPFYAGDYKAYDVSKAAVNMLAVNYARVLADVGGFVNAGCPGLVATAMTGYIAYGTTAEVGCKRIAELATLTGKDTEVTGTFSGTQGPIPW